MSMTRTLFARLMLVLALIVALASSGLAHRFAPNEADVALAAYVAAGGSYADICADAESGPVQSCDACRLVDSAAIPMAVPGCPVSFATDTRAIGHYAAVVPQHPVFDPVRAVRAPPVG